MRTICAVLILLAAPAAIAATRADAQVPAPAARSARPEQPAGPAPAPAARPAGAPRAAAPLSWDEPFELAVPMPGEPLAPMAAPAPMAPMAPLAPLAPDAPWAPVALEPPLAPLAPEPSLAPLAPEAPLAPLPPGPFAYQGQGRRIDRARIAEEAREQALEQARADRDMIRQQALQQSEQMRAQQDMIREQALEQARVQGSRIREEALAQARAQRDMARDFGQTFGQNFSQGFGREFSQNFTREFSSNFSFNWSSNAGPPAPWAQRDPADSLYRAAYETMNKGDYRKAAAMFKEIPAKFQYSAYAADAMYWTAHALYRVGSTPDLQDALQTLEQLKQKYPNSRLRGSQADVAALEVRIAGVLSARGQGGSEIVKRALSENANVCDTEEQQIRAAALNALMQTDPDAAQDYAQKTLTHKDDCSREIRRTAVFLIGNNGDPKATATLINVAKTDPSPDVRSSAVQYLGRMPGDDALNALQELARSDTSSRIQRAAIQQLARMSDPRARIAIKTFVERSDVPENLRVTALDALDPDHATQEDVAWLQATYSKVDSPRVRSRIISAMARIGGTQNEKWFMTLANNENESIDVRVEALRRAGQNMDIAALGRLYDQTGQRQLRYELVRQLEGRREPEATDKLGEIARDGTDIEVRKRAIEALSNKAKSDERASKLLLQLIDRP